MPEAPPAPPPPPIDCARMPSASAPSVSIRPLCVTSTAPAWEPLPPGPPTEICISLLAFSILFEASPPLPPEPPIDCAKMPRARSPEVATCAELSTETSPAMPPSPPSRPTETETPPPWLPFLFSPLTLTLVELLAPPDPPIDCAWMPTASSPVVITRPAALTATSPAMPPLPPGAPMPTEISFFGPIGIATSTGQSSSKNAVRSSSDEASPPPEAIDCARIPAEAAPSVTIVPSCVTVTSPALPPSPPLPPMASETTELSFISAPVMFIAPLPPPPLIDWARMPLAPPPWV